MRTPYLLLAALFPLAGLHAAPPQVFHVFPHGSQAGTFASLERARDAVRELKRKQGGLLRQPVTVWIHGGTYRLVQPLQFTAEDSGTADCPVTYAAFGKDRPVLSGGRVIRGWKPVTVVGKKLWAVEIPEVRAGKWYFHQLWIDGERRQRARSPNNGFFRIAAVPGLTRETTLFSGQDRFQFIPGEISTYENPQDVDVMLLTFWFSTRLGIAAVDPATHMVTLTRKTPQRLTDGFGILPHLARYYIENAMELLDAPGEWYLNRKTGVLYYMPFPGEDVRAEEAVAPVLEDLLLVDSADHLTFRRLAFEHAEWWVRGNGAAGAVDARENIGNVALRQGSVFMPAAIRLSHAKECSFDSCTLAHIAQYAIHFSRGCERDRVVRCEMFDLGTGGVKIGEVDPREAPHHIEVTDSHIYDGGVLTPSSHAVWIGLSPSNLVVHNHIHDFNYIAVSIGWNWRYGQPFARDNVIEYNHIHDIGKGVLSDMGAVYTLGVLTGTVIRYNLLHDIQCADYGASGIYFDMSSAGILAEKNLVYRTSTGGLHQNYGKENVVRNNILALGQNSQIELGSKDGALPGPNEYHFEHNIVYWARGAKFLASAWNNTAVVLEKNLYWQEGTNDPAFGRLTFAQWQAHGLDAASIVADPLFVDPANCDFRLRPESPAFRLGFESFDLTGVGPRPLRATSRP